jgi:hypothetical protein
MRLADVTVISRVIERTPPAPPVNFEVVITFRKQ